MSMFDKNINLEINPVNALKKQLLNSGIGSSSVTLQIRIASSFVNSRRSWKAAK